MGLIHTSVPPSLSTSRNGFQCVVCLSLYGKEARRKCFETVDRQDTGRRNSTPIKDSRVLDGNVSPVRETGGSENKVPSTHG